MSHKGRLNACDEVNEAKNEIFCLQSIGRYMSLCKVKKNYMLETLSFTKGVWVVDRTSGTKIHQNSSKAFTEANKMDYISEKLFSRGVAEKRQIKCASRFIKNSG